MLPRVIGERRARRWMLGFALVLWAVMLVPWIVGLLGIVYGVTASLAGFAFVARIVESMRLGTEAADRAVFRTSLVVLASVLGVALVECALR
jgi:protoheme IX farnesyltransferase